MEVFGTTKWSNLYDKNLTDSSIYNKEIGSKIKKEVEFFNLLFTTPCGSAGALTPICYNRHPAICSTTSILFIVAMIPSGVNETAFSALVIPSVVLSVLWFDEFLGWIKKDTLHRVVSCVP